MADVDPSGFYHQEEHRQEEADIDGNFNDEPLHHCSIELMELRLGAFVYQEPSWFFDLGCLFDIFEVSSYLVFFNCLLVGGWVVSVLSDQDQWESMQGPQDDTDVKRVAKYLQDSHDLRAFSAQSAVHLSKYACAKHNDMGELKHQQSSL